MKHIAANIDDNVIQMRAKATEQLKKPGFAMDRYFYRSHVTYKTELTQTIYKSWLYAGHICQHKKTR
ncbi:MAG: hypothetical protein ACI8RO_001704 [Flavobacteriales bacterium]